MENRRSPEDFLIGMVITACLLASGLDCLSAPPFIKPCYNTDTDCLTKAANQAVDGYTSGIPELGIPILDPFSIDNLEFNLVGLNITFENGTLRGLKNCVVKEARTNLEEKYINIKLVCDLTLKGKYSANGNVLLFTIKGEGNAKVKIKQMQLDFKSHWDIVIKEDGKKYFELRNIDGKSEVKKNMHFTLSNLFNGNKELSDVTHTFINENWKQIFDEFGAPIVNYSINLAKINLKKFFGGIPAYELLAIDDFK